jgi:5-methylcytosine-specific restriction endonuclease McrA
MRTDSCGLMLLTLLCLVWLAWTWSHRPSFPSQSAAVTARIQRLLKPRIPDDCPRCHQQRLQQAPRRPVTPWRDHKSRRAAPKRIATQGFACPNHLCAVLSDH